VDHTTIDAFCKGHLQVKQAQNGYRFAIDSVILANHIPLTAKARVLDLGTGCGIVALILARRFPDSTIWGLELQKLLAALAAENVILNNFEKQIGIIRGDLCNFSLAPKALKMDWVVSNPPYRKKEAGRLNPEVEKAIAMHELTTDIKDVVAAAGRVLKPAGGLFMIYPAERITDLFLAMRAGDIEPKVLRMVHTRRQNEARRVLVKGVKHGHSGLAVAAPLIVHNDDGSYTAEMQRMMAL
jgi:tRNA1Val (adenine37-N6)-methyltransferase